MTRRIILLPGLKPHFQDPAGPEITSLLIEVKSASLIPDMFGYRQQIAGAGRRGPCLSGRQAGIAEMSLDQHSGLHRFNARLGSRSALSEAEQAAILALPIKVVQIAPHRDFLPLGQQIPYSSLIVDGLVARFNQMPDGRRQIMALYIAGDMPDLSTVVQPNQSFGLQALSPVTLLRIPHAALREAATAHPSVGLAFWQESAAEADKLAQWVVNLGRRDARSRIANLICEMAFRYGAVTTGSGFEFGLPMTQEELADATGLTPVHVNRSLMSLRSAGLLFRGRRVRIDDWALLVTIACFDDGYLQVRPLPANAVDHRGIVRPSRTMC